MFVYVPMLNCNMSSVADQIAKFTEPVPQIADAEDDFNIDSNARLSEKKLLDCEDISSLHSGSLRKRTDPLLQETDAKYAGRRISRKSLEDISNSNPSDVDDRDDDKSSDIDDDEFSADEAHIEAFKQMLSSSQKMLAKEVEESVGDEDEESEHTSGESSSDESQGEETGSESESADDFEHDMIQQFSQVSVASEVEKGIAVQSQQELWFKLCECRIKLQKLLLVANKLPQYETWNGFKEKSDESYKISLQKAARFVRSLLKNFVDFQMELLKYNVKTVEEDESGTAESNEEIPSEECSGSDQDVSKEERSITLNCSQEPKPKKSLKRKRSCNDYGDILSKRHKSLVSYRNSIIQNWDQKTRLTTGKVTEKSFDMFDQTAMNQINQILLDKKRLIKRTQVKRADYHVLGKVEVQVSKEEENEVSEEVKLSDRRNLSVLEHDPEIFDDEDFYRQLLKDVIESKSVGIDPVVLSKQLEIQRVRSKIKRKVDTKASKGRKIRYDVHPKLVNFMAPVTNMSMSFEANIKKFSFAVLMSH